MRHYGHGHRHKKHERKQGKHIMRHHHLGRCLSESELTNIGNINRDVKERICLIVRAFFNRRYQWGREGDSEEKSCDEDFSMKNVKRWRRHHHRRWSHQITGRNPDADRKNTTSTEGNEEENIDDYHGYHDHHYHHHHGRYGFHLKGRRHHGEHHGFRGGRFSDEDLLSSSSDDEKRHWKRGKHHHKKRHYEKHTPRGWRRHERCVCSVNASTMTEDAVENQNSEVSGNQEPVNDKKQAPFSLQIQEVIENLEKSSLDHAENEDGPSPHEVQEVTEHLHKTSIAEEEWIVL